MDQDKEREEDLPHRDQREIKKEAEENREDADKAPPHGADPLHEGP